MGESHDPPRDHSKDWLKFGGLGCAYYGGALVLLVAVVVLIVLLLRWIF